MMNRATGYLVLAGVAWAGVWVAPSLAQSASADAYTRYELLEPGTASFRIVYDVTATTAGAQFYFNPIRAGSVATDESVIDRVTGSPLKFEVVSGEVARRDGQRGAGDGEYIKVHLSRPVPAGGEARLRIIKTYQDAESYKVEGDQIVFDRSLGIKRNGILLPAGYEIVSSNFPSQVLQETDGRLLVSHWNNTPSAAPVVIRARPLARAAAIPRPEAPAASPAARPGPAAATPAAAPADELRNLRIVDRAVQDREIVYFLQQPETHSFNLYHDYTESRVGVDSYRNVVRGGSTVSNPSAVNLDTGETLAVDTTRGADGSEVVVIRFAPVKAGHSTRIRITETYTDASRYAVVNGELVWHRSFGRPVNDMVLPEGWSLTATSIPAVITTEADGRTRLSYINPRPDAIDVIVKARRR
ncbi:MAG TPA: hypothetical protein VMM93_00990 [Vicinamibacterales bacterium]|nr:hypothetical protein [Vicinamibacterales bacterium]